MLAQKLGELCALYDPNEVMDRIFPLAITFAKDEISSVREDSVHVSNRHNNFGSRSHTRFAIKLVLPYPLFSYREF